MEIGDCPSIDHINHIFIVVLSQSIKLCKISNQEETEFYFRITKLIYSEQCFFYI